MEAILILLKNYQSTGEAFFIGLMQGIVLFSAVAIWRGIRNARQRNRKEWDEISKDESTHKAQGKTDWKEIKKDNN